MNECQADMNSNFQAENQVVVNRAFGLPGKIFCSTDPAVFVRLVQNIVGVREEGRRVASRIYDYALC